MEMTLKSLADKIGEDILGDGSVIIKGIKEPLEAGEGDLVYFKKEKDFKMLLPKLRASAAILPKTVKDSPIPAILAKRPEIAFAKALNILYPSKKLEPRIHETAIIGKNTKIGNGVVIMPYVVIGDDVIIEDDVVIYPHVVIEDGVFIGRGTIIYSNVTIRYNCKIGRECILHPGVVIGADGFGFEDDGDERLKVPQIGIVEIGDRVEIGANSCVDRATLGKTVIGNDTKIDNLVQIGHNCKIGEKCYFAGQAGVAGSTTIGNWVIVGGQSAISDHLNIGDGVIVMGKTGVSKNLKPKEIVFGTPARPVRESHKINALLSQLPKFIERIKSIEEKIEVSEKKNS